ncbi:hypothetical protein BRE01_27410 [Brevibacillus reuszeri]|uniref:Membrane protein n=1 Tax=Brevibacillus reuszeri TaxID=54915 RepID=A0A0K9YK21_9BACL|nr:hypothetical protein [Brevibacillus reuszeri]KNB68545.1 membrane protein [Brevibacillus reuszeri]MED1858824.1 hypothetical protein [Brevibacillus reuszeri]GED69039.1 hypothetical protein BRE01_27410 [Brevibacillus reuszeri]
MYFPIFLMVMGIVLMLQPRTNRWKTRMKAAFQGNEKRVKQRANTFFILGFTFLLAGFAYLYRFVS